MRKTIKIFVVVLFVILGVAVFMRRPSQECNRGVCSLSTADALAGVSSLQAADLPSDSEQISFVELGSVNCIPCKKMQPIIDEIKKEYAGKVKVVFHDVWTQEGKVFANEYDIRVIPTQVFLDKSGKEITRHEGFFPKADIEKIFNDNGVTK